MQTIRSVGVFSVAKILGVVYASMGLIFVPFFLLMGLIGAFAGPRDNPSAAMIGSAGLAVVALLLPVFYGIFGFIVGAIGALLYNLFAKWIGGIELNLEPANPVNMISPAV